MRGVHFATIGWILPLLHDPDGHEVRFYSVESHTTLDPDAPLTVDDAIGASARGRVARRAGIGLAPLDGSRAMNEWAQASALLGAIEYVEGGPLAVG